MATPVLKAILFMGLQASGKSTFYDRFMSEYVHINLDSLHTRNKERILLTSCLEEQRSFVVDNTNPLAEDRARYIKAAREYGYEVEGSLPVVVWERVWNHHGNFHEACYCAVFTPGSLVYHFFEAGFADCI